MEQRKQITLTPFLVVNNASNAVEFYVSAFEATVSERHETSETKVIAKVSVDGAEFWVGDEEPQFGNVSPRANEGSAIRMILQTEDADELFENAAPPKFAP
jgi:PhnB protein